MCKHTVCLTETTLADNVTWTVDILEWNDGPVTFRGVQYVDNLHSVKVDHHSSTGTTRDILDLVCLEGGLGREGKAKIHVQGEGEHSNLFCFHVP